jgi:hypothetical protein
MRGTLAHDKNSLSPSHIILKNNTIAIASTPMTGLKPELKMRVSEGHPKSTT